MHRAIWATPLTVAFFVSIVSVSSNNRDIYFQKFDCYSEETKKTKAAKIPKNNLSCYICDTTVDGERCSNLNIGNKSTLLRKCEQEQWTCMVKRFSYTTSTENSTSILRMWSLQRSCTEKCEPGCIVIGERTKLYACTSCCNKTGCNTGKGRASTSAQSISSLVLLPTLFILYFHDFTLISR